MKKNWIFKFSNIKKLGNEIFLSNASEDICLIFSEKYVEVQFPLFEMDFQYFDSLKSSPTEAGGYEAKNDLLKDSITTVYGDNREIIHKGEYRYPDFVCFYVNAMLKFTII